MASPLQKLFEFSEGQWGLVTRRQAEYLGVPAATFARLVGRGLLDRVAHGVYRIRGAGEADHLELRAAWLQLDSGRPAWERLDDQRVVVVSHTSAAAMYGVGDLRADVHEFTSPQRRQTRRPDVRIHRGLMADDDRIVLRGLPVTRPGRTIADLLVDRIEPVSVARITADVLEGSNEYPRVVAEKMAPHAADFGMKAGDGVGLLEHFLDLAGDRLERRRILEEARS
jgi:hypothetical protein